MFDRYNEFCRLWSDFDEENQFNDTTSDKRIPYIGWSWRAAGFANKWVHIGRATGLGDGTYVGVMENNKWGYPSRLMTEEEVEHFIDFLDSAMKAAAREEFEYICAEMRAWFKTLVVEGE